MYAGLSLEQAPPLRVPFLFFAVAPLGGILAAVVLLVGDPVALSGRWSRDWFVVSHLVLLGFNTMVMMGAILQMLPVVAGVVIRHSVGLSRTIVIVFMLGLGGLLGGFVFDRWSFVWPLVVGLFVALAVFLSLALQALLRSKARYDTVLAMQAALSFLAVTICLGLLLVAGRLQWVSFPRPLVTDAHLGLGVLGWMGLLIVGVSYQVIPMFHLTPPYPLLFRQAFVVMLTVLLSCYAAAAVLRYAGYRLLDGRLFLAGVVVLYAVFCVVTLWLLARKKRKVSDATLWFWRQALGVGLGLSALWVYVTLANVYSARLGLFFGLNLVYGVIMPIKVGMLLKIVPFLVWFHVQSQQLPLMMAGKTVTVPHMKQIVSETTIRQLFALHVAGLILVNVGLWSARLPMSWTGWLPMAFFAALMWVVGRAWHTYGTFQKPEGPPAAAA